MGDKGWNHGIRGIRVEIMGDKGQFKVGMDRFYLFFKRSFRYENDDEKTKKRNDGFKNDRFLMEIVLK